ncbi:MAG: hypothetical protein ACJ8AW_49030 [Rhodopila sp.]
MADGAKDFFLSVMAGRSPGHLSRHVRVAMARTSRAMTVEERYFFVRHLTLIRTWIPPALAHA